MTEGGGLESLFDWKMKNGQRPFFTSVLHHNEVHFVMEPTLVAVGLRTWGHAIRRLSMLLHNTRVS